MARRGHGEGSITKRKDGRYQAALTLDNHKRKYFYGKTRKEVQDKLNRALYEQKQGMLATGPQRTLKVQLEQWLEQVVKLTGEPNTYRTYEWAMKSHIVPALGHLKLQKLTVGDVQAFYAEKAKTLKPRSLASIHAALSGALEDAVKQGFVARNVASLVSTPSADRYEGQILTVEQAKRLLEVAESSRLDALLLLVLTMGLRIGEVTALCWSDVDLEKGVLQVRRGLVRIRGKGLVEREPKSKAGRRKIVLPRVVIEALKRHRERQLNKGSIRTEDIWRVRSPVFCNRLGKYLDPVSLRRSFKRLLKVAGLPDIRFHDLRHSAATVLLAAGVPLKVVSEMLGHSSIAITADIYADVLPEQQQEVARKLDDLYGAS